MYKKVCCTCKVDVMLIKPIAFLTFSLPSPSSSLKLPYEEMDEACKGRICSVLHVQGCYYANQTYCFFDLLATVAVFVAKAPL